MATFTGSTIASTYKQLLKVTSEGIGDDASAKYIEDGLGTDSALSISTTRVGIGTSAPSTILEIAGAHTGGLGMLHIDSTDHAFITLDSASSSHDSGIFFAEGGTAQMRLEFDASENAINFHDSVGGASRMVLTQAGSVGIGAAPAVTGTPSLCIEGTAPVFTLRDSSSSAQATQFFRTHLDAGIVYNIYDDGGTYRIGHADDVDGVCLLYTSDAADE